MRAIFLPSQKETPFDTFRLCRRYYHPLTACDGKNLREAGKKNAKAAPFVEGFALAYFFSMPAKSTFYLHS